jgi:hypothetical protein
MPRSSAEGGSGGRPAGASRTARTSGAAGAVSADRGRSRRRGQVEPLAALAALFAVTVGLSLYAGALGMATPEPGREPAASNTLDTVAGAAAAPTGVVQPGRLDGAVAAVPAQLRVKASLRFGAGTICAGPPLPDRTATDTERAARRVGVRRSPGQVAVGRLRVVVW